MRMRAGLRYPPLRNRDGPRNPLLRNRMQGDGGGGRHVSVQLNRHILDSGSTGELCELIEAHV